MTKSIIKEAGEKDNYWQAITLLLFGKEMTLNAEEQGKICLAVHEIMVERAKNGCSDGIEYMALLEGFGSEK